MEKSMREIGFRTRGDDAIRKFLKLEMEQIRDCFENVTGLN